MHADPLAHRTRLLAMLFQSAADGAPLQARLVASLVGRNAFELVQQSLRNPSTAHLAMNDRLQEHLRNVVTVVAAAQRHFGSVARGVHWFRTAPLPDAAAPTPESMTLHGRPREACAYLPAGARGDAPGGEAA